MTLSKSTIGGSIHLDDIDAPESAQLCLRDGRKERCGQRAAFLLADLIGQGTMRCIPHDVDRYGRDIATCWLGDVTLNERMVAAGQAVAYRKHSKRYIAAEGEAEAAGLGIWSTRFEMPWDYRRTHQRRREADIERLHGDALGSGPGERGCRAVRSDCCGDAGGAGGGVGKGLRLQRVLDVGQGAAALRGCRSGRHLSARSRS